MADAHVDALTLPRTRDLGQSEAWAFLRRLTRRRTALVGLVVLVGVVLAALLAPALTPFDPLVQDISQRLKPPGWVSPEGRAHWLGTDHLGRDILGRILYGARIALVVGLAAVAIAGVLGLVIGLVSGYFGGWIDDLFMRLADVQLAFPFILLAITVVAVLGAGFRNVIIVLGVAGWMVYARLVRGEVLALREKEFIAAARALGVPNRTIIPRHVLPNVLTPVIVVATFSVATNIITEASLSFLGLGVEPSIPTWGAMLSDGRAYMGRAWWLTTLPGLAILVTVLAINQLGDWLRDRFDPRLRNL
jgi:peptide/nickel transport system permease protein